MATKPVTKYPSNPISKWPPAGGTPFEATPWDNWWTLARECGREGYPWDVIYFNFRTADSAEVSWYMANLLGCHQTTKNKKHYKFARKDGQPIQVYLPDPAWKLDPTVGVPPRPERPEMSVGDNLTAAMMLAVLGSGAIARIYFNIGPYNINALNFRSVADRIRSGTFAVYQIPADSDKAHYDPESNAFYMRLGWDLSDLAKVVHEAVHAIFDLRKANNIFTVDDEAAAYLAESIFARVYAGPSEMPQLKGGKFETNQIFLKAFHLANLVVDGVDLVDADFDELRYAVAAHPEYLARARNVAGYDGVYEMAPAG